MEAKVAPGMGLLKKESFRALEEQDRVRIKAVLDYWFQVHDMSSSQSSFHDSDAVEIKKNKNEKSGQNKGKGVSF